MKNLTKVMLCVAALSLFSGAASAAPVYVGTWNVDDGPSWVPNGSQPIINAVEVAAMLFGGSASDYVISTVSTAVADINNSAWYSIWGTGPQIKSETYKNDSGIVGKYDTYGDSSAWVADHCYQGGCINYAFKVDVPAPASLLIAVVGLLGLSIGRRQLAA